MPAKDYNYIVYGDDIEEHDNFIQIHTDHEEGC
jgi:hypothetical protein